MIKINTKILNLDEVFRDMKHGEAWLMAWTLKDIKAELEETKAIMIDNSYQGANMTAEVIAIEQQLWFVNQNIRTLEDALMCFETKIFEHKVVLMDLYNICLN